MKHKAEIKPNCAPVYCAAMYPDLCKIFQQHGYALAVHGSLARDFDLIAIPWTEEARNPVLVMQEVFKAFCIKQIGKPEKKLHGRVAITLSVGFGECAIDLSFMPLKRNSHE